MCLYPKLVKNPKYKVTKKNGGNVPEMKDHRVGYVPIACQECLECRKAKAREWQIRITEDIKHNPGGKFITLTFSNESIKELIEQKPTKNWASLKGLEGYQLDNEIATRAMRLFLERWRKKYKKSVRHWMITELGHEGTENIHLHGIIWGDPNEIERIWKYGWIWKGERNPNDESKPINYVNESTANYVTKYIHKIDKDHPNYKPKMLTSDGIGNGYTKTIQSNRNKYKPRNTEEHYRTRTGHKIALPIYWRNKIYTEEEREKLWLEKLDKEERWILGNRINIKEGEEGYYKALEWAQQKNEELGYGNGEKDWEQIAYENDRRKIKIRERIEKAEQSRRRGNSKDIGPKIATSKNNMKGQKLGPSQVRQNKE